MTKKFVVIGGGPGGYVAAIRAAQLGGEVHLVESGSMGGTCLNVGCIPTKTLLHTAELYRTVLKEARNGLLADNVRIDWPTLQKRKTTVVRRLVNGVSGVLKANGVTIHSGRATLQGNKTVQVEGAQMLTLTADVIVLAAGSSPVLPAFPGADLGGVIDSAGALSLAEMPRTLTIVGGGVIGTEFAALFNALGTEVSVIEALSQILPNMDGQIAALVKKKMTGDGINFFTESRLLGIEKESTGLVAKVLVGGEERQLLSDRVLIAVGRKPSTAGLGLERLGIAVNNGSVTVDENLMTNIPDIYAIGDCNGLMMLAHAASAQGTAAVEHALGHPCTYRGDKIPNCIYTNPEAAGVGLTEEQAKAKGLEYKVGLFPLNANGKSMIEGAEVGLVKIIAASESGKILGAHMIGPRVTDIIGEIGLAMTLEATVDELVATIHAHPTISEAIGEAAMGVYGQPIHWPPGVKMQ